MDWNKPQELDIRDLAHFLLRIIFWKARSIPHYLLNILKIIFIIQIYVDNIIFSSTNESLCESFAKIISQEFKMSLMGELTFFIGLQIKKLSDGTFISQTKYTLDLLKWF